MAKTGLWAGPGQERKARILPLAGPSNPRITVLTQQSGQGFTQNVGIDSLGCSRKPEQKPITCSGGFSGVRQQTRLLWDPADMSAV